MNYFYFIYIRKKYRSCEFLKVYQFNKYKNLGCIYIYLKRTN
jgi:hypothetical protein